MTRLPDADSGVEALYRAHHVTLVQQAMALGCDQRTAEAVVLDAFVDAHERWERFADPESALRRVQTRVVRRARKAARSVPGGSTYDEPVPDLAELRRRTAGREPSSARAWLGIVAAAVAVALIVAVIALIEHSTQAPDDGGDGRPRPDGGPQSVDATGWFVGTTSQGPRLFAEKRAFRGRPGTSGVQVVTSAVVTGDTVDTDLRSAFPAGTTVRVAPGDSAWDVDLRGDASAIAAAPTDASGEVGVQAVVRTIQGMLGRRTLVVFSINGSRADRVLGVDTRAAVARLADDDVLAPVRIDEPANDVTLSRSFTVRGVATAADATVHRQLVKDGVLAKKGTATTSACCAPSAYQFTVDDLPTGAFTLVVQASGGGTVDQDTKVVSVVGSGTNGSGNRLP